MKNVVLFLSLIFGFQYSLAALSDQQCSQKLREVLDLRQKKENVILRQYLHEHNATGYNQFILAVNNRGESQTKAAEIEQLLTSARLQLSNECSPYYLKILNQIEK